MPKKHSIDLSVMENQYEILWMCNPSHKCGALSTVKLFCKEEASVSSSDISIPLTLLRGQIG